MSHKKEVNTHYLYFIKIGITDHLKTQFLNLNYISMKYIGIKTKITKIITIVGSVLRDGLEALFIIFCFLVFKGSVNS